MSRIGIIGAGAAGCMAAVMAAQNGHEVTVFEKNEKIGKKLYITGKGRCNLTNNCDAETFFASVLSNPKFLYSAYYGFDADAVMDFFTSAGLALKTERGGRVFPQSDHSSDVIKTLKQEMDRVGVNVRFHHTVDAIARDKDGFVLTGECPKGAFHEPFDKILLACGGLSYPATGSTGDGYRLAASLGHTLESTYPALVPLEVKESYAAAMQGLSLKNVTLSVYVEDKWTQTLFGEMLFTHFGVSGPLVLSVSSALARPLAQKKRVRFTIDLKSALPEEELHARLVREFQENANKNFRNILPHLLPQKMVDVVMELSGIRPETKGNEITKEMRASLVTLLKAFPLTVTGTRGYHEAIITGGGVKVSEVDPHTMESKLVQGLYLAGEMLDLDAYTGGFNLQIAWSTGALAGRSM